MATLTDCLDTLASRLHPDDLSQVNQQTQANIKAGMAPGDAALAAVDSVLSSVQGMAQEDTSLGGYRFRETRDGRLTVYGDPEEIRAKLPAGIKGSISGKKVTFTSNAAPRVKAALSGSSVAYSRGGNVLSKLPMKDGKYIGAPDKYNTPHKIPKLRRELKQLTMEGERGRFWYENSSREVLRVTGGDVQEARRLVALLSIYSPQAKVDTNTTFAIRAWMQYKMGQPIQVKTRVQDEKAQAAMDDVEGFWSGEKTGNFYFNLLREIDPTTAGKQGATIDMWMMRAGQYDHDAPTTTEYAFMENETNRIAQELGWEPQQVQAAIWVAMKARMENAGVKKRTEEISEKKGWISYKNPKTKTGRIVHDDEAHFANWIAQAMKHEPTEKDTSGAKFDFADGMMRHIGQVSWEPRISTSLPYMPGIHDADYDQQLAYYQAIKRVLYNDQGQDRLAMQLGMLTDVVVDAPGVREGGVFPSGQTRMVMSPAQAGTMRVKSDVLSETDWVSRGSPEGYEKVEVHLKQGTRVEYTKEVDRLTEKEWEAAGKPKGYTKEPALDSAQKEALRIYTSVLGLLLRQDGVGYHRPFPAPSLKRANGVELRIGRPFTAEETRQYEGAILELYEARGWDSQGVGLIGSPEGLRVVSFVPHEDFKQFHTVVEMAAQGLSDGMTVQPTYFTSDGDLTYNDWVTENNGEGFTRTITSSRRPDVLGWARDNLAPEVQTVNEEYAQRFGWGDPGVIRFSRSDASSRRDALDSSRYGTGKPAAQAAPQPTEQQRLADALANSDLPGGSLLAEQWTKLIAGTEFDTPAIRAGLAERAGQRVYRADLAAFSVDQGQSLETLQLTVVDDTGAEVEVSAADLLTQSHQRVTSLEQLLRCASR